MRISDNEYLKRTLRDHKERLRHIEVIHRIEIAKYEKEKEMLYSEINSIESQLEDGKKDEEPKQA